MRRHTFKEQLAVKLLMMIKCNENGFVICARNHLIFSLINFIGVDLETLVTEIVNSYNNSKKLNIL